MFKRFDHLSVAVSSIDDGYKLFKDSLGATVIREKTKGYDGTFSWAELMLGGLKLELIQPEGSDSFVKKFVEQSGSKMHHITFEVKDLEKEINLLEKQGFRIFGRTMDDPEWKIAFIHPKTAAGVLIQIYEPKV